MKPLVLAFVFWLAVLLTMLWIVATHAHAQSPTPTPVGVVVVATPDVQTVHVGDDVTLDIRVSTFGYATCFGGVFLQFDTGALAFTGGMNNTAVWNSVINDVEPAVRDPIGQPGVISLSVGVGSPLNGSNVLVSTLHFTALLVASTTPQLMFVPGMQETQFYASNCTSRLDTQRVDATIEIVGPVSPTPGGPTNTPGPATPTPGPACCDCGEANCAAPAGDGSCPQGCTRILNSACAPVGP